MTGPETRWAIRLIGNFELPDCTFFVPCRDEQIARSRALWWRKGRSDVLATPVFFKPGEGWWPVDRNVENECAGVTA